MTSFNLKGLADKLAKQQPQVEQQDSTLPLDQIQNRQQDTRTLKPDHVESLAESIAVLGLIEPLVVDKQGRLLAGGHRLAAIHLLKEVGLDKYQTRFPGDRVPVRMLDFDAEKEPELALQIEVAENEQRRDYTAGEVRAIADRLRSAGYVDVKGRPKEGDKPLMPALAVVVGKHLRTVRRYLNDDQENGTGKSRTSAPLSESRTHALLLQQALSKLVKLQALEAKTPKQKALSKELPKIIRLIDELLDEEKATE